MAMPNNDTPMIRRVLLSVGAMLGASALFVTACMLLVVAVLDRAVPPKQHATDIADVAEASGVERTNDAPADAPRRGAAPRAAKSDTRS